MPILNRIKIVLAESLNTGIWITCQLEKSNRTVSYIVQSDFETIVEIAKCLNVRVVDLVKESE